jgi:hypothetical protein
MTIATFTRRARRAAFLESPRPLPRRLEALAMRLMLLVLLVLLVPFVPLVPLGASAQPGNPWDAARSVTRAELLAALVEQRAQGYRLDAIANAVRLQTGVFLRLAAEEDRRAEPRALRIRHADWMAAFCEATALAPEATPPWVQVPFRHHEDYLVDGRTAQVVDLAATPSPPRRAMTVTAGWPSAPGAPASYTYEDRSTDPAIETTRAQVNGYRVLDYGDAIVVDGIHGVGGRATSGLLGIVFDLIGHARAVQSRFAIAPDGTQVSRTTARKGLTLTHAVAIAPDGKVTPHLPADRPDLAEIDARLARLKIEVVYRPAQLVPPVAE